MLNARASRLRLGPNTYGLWSGWLAFCPGNDWGAFFWVQLPLVYLELNRDFVELAFGRGDCYLALTARWRW